MSQADKKVGAMRRVGLDDIVLQHRDRSLAAFWACEQNAVRVCGKFWPLRLE